MLHIISPPQIQDLKFLFLSTCRSKPLLRRWNALILIFLGMRESFSTEKGKRA